MSEAAIDKALLAFLNGLSKRLYFEQKDLTDDFLRNEVLGIEEEGEDQLNFVEHHKKTFPRPS
jgi:hypothetical protein